MPSMPFGSLWLPVVVSAIAVFIVSSLLHMVLRYHRADHRKLPDEDAVRAALAKDRPAPAVYMLPHCDPAQMKDPAVKEKYEKGPLAIITIGPSGMPNMGKYLTLWFLLSLLVSFTAGYVARKTLNYDADGLTIMRVTGTVAFAAYGVSHISDSIWKWQPWSNTLRALLDAIIYAIITGLSFRLLWPSA